MKSGVCALAVLLAALGPAAAWSESDEGPLPPITAPPALSSVPSSTAVRPAPRVAPRPPLFAPASAAKVSRLSADAREARRFLRDAAAQSRFELEASRLAFAKSSNGPVRSLAASLINHHNEIGLELTHLLHSRGMALPMMSNDQRKALNRMAKLHGKKFDAVYMEQVGLHQAKVAAEYEKAGSAIQEPQINAWIVKTLPTTRYHLTMAERAAPGNPQLARWNRAPVKAAVAKTPAAMPQVPGSLATQPLPAPSGAGVQPVATTLTRPLNGSNTP